MNIIKLSQDDIITMKKSHPCSATAFDFAVLRLGSDIRIRCLACSHEVTVPRVKLEKSIKLVNKQPPIKTL